MNSPRLSCASRRTCPLVQGLLALLIAAPLSARAATVWVASSSEKIGPKMALPASIARSASLSAAKNEFEAFQIAITGAATDVSATATALTGPGSESIPAPRLFREALIQVVNASATDGGTGWFPDAMVPDVDDVVGEKRNAFPFNVPASETRVLWVELHVPAHAAPGLYQGSVTLHLSGADVVVPLMLNVWDFALPSTSSLRSHFGLAWGDLPAGHGVSDHTSDFAALRARYSQLGLDHRISMGGTDDGYPASDLAHFVQWYGALCDGTAPTQLKGAQLTTVSFRSDGTTGTALTAAAHDWATEFKKHALPGGKTWFDKLFDYTCDEPPTFCKDKTWGDINRRSAAIKAADPAFKTLVTTTLADADAHGVTKAIDILVPIVNDLDNRPGYDTAGFQRSKYDGFLAARAGREVWTYQSCMSHGCGGSDPYFTGWPSVVIDALSMRARSEEWLSFLFNLSGELYWEVGYAYLLGDAWASQWSADFTGNGDGTLFYPGTPAKIGGTTHIPIASLRLKMIREGMEDFEYLKALSDAGDPQLARDLASALFPNAWTEPTAAALLSTRHAIADRIVALTHPPAAGVAPGPGSTPPPNETGTDPATAPPPVTDRFLVSGSGCSAGSAAEVFAGLGLLAALGLRRRRR